MMFLQQYGISLSLGAKIFNQYGHEMYGILRENPYRMAEDIDGVGFKMADEIAARIGMHTDSDYRIEAVFIHITAGNCRRACVPSTAYSAGTGICPFGRCRPLYGKTHYDLAIDRKIVVKEVDLRKGAQPEPVIYASQYYQLELHVAQMLKELALEDTVDENKMELQLARLEKAEMSSWTKSSARQLQKR